jgi:hypothetical protein
MGGSDFYILGIYQHYYLKNNDLQEKKKEYDDINYYINYLSKYNGYYDTSNNIKVRHHNLKLYFNKLKKIYLSNILNYNATNFYSNEFSKYFNKNDHLNLKYISYHLINENKYFFDNIILEKYKNKKILIISPFCNLIEKQIPNLKYLYNKDVDNKFIFLNTYITYFNEDNDTYTNTPHNNFEETVKYYTEKINKLDFDVALLSCGSYAHFLGEIIKIKEKKHFMSAEYYNYILDYMVMDI